MVVTSRNDDHGKNLLRRMQLFIDGLAEQAVRFGVSVELIIVEWNPPIDRPPLAAALRWPRGPNPAVRILRVSPERHGRFASGQRLPLFQMIGKNVGIRRATGEFILATNIDILFSDSLFKFLAGPLDERTLYRADRHDVDAAVLDAGDAAPERVRLEHPVRRELKDGTYVDGEGRVLAINQGVGDFLISAARRAVSPNYTHGRLIRMPTTLGNVSRSLYRLVRVPKLHTNACGDFTLISREGWKELRGYPEWEMYSMHIDSILLFHAASRRFRIVELPKEMATIHVDHEVGSGWSLEGEAKLFQRLSAADIPFLSDDDLGRVAMALDKARRRNLLTGFNLAGWGLADEDVEEVSLSVG